MGENQTSFRDELKKLAEVSELLENSIFSKGTFSVIVELREEHFKEVVGYLSPKDLKQKKIVIDIAIPHDLDAEIVKKNPITHISIDYLQKISDRNLLERSKEIVHVEQILSDAVESFMYIHKMRQVEIAMREVPNMVKDIRATAVNEVFKKELQTLDDDSREVLDKIIGYMEKKYMSMPMKLAKEIMLKS